MGKEPPVFSTSERVCQIAPKGEHQQGVAADTSMTPGGQSNTTSDVSETSLTQTVEGNSDISKYKRSVGKYEKTSHQFATTGTHAYHRENRKMMPTSVGLIYFVHVT